MAPSPDIDDLSNAELRSLVVALLSKVADLQRTVAAQRDEIARLKGLKGPPSIKPNKPSGMEKATTRSSASRRQGKGRGKKPTPRVAVEDRVVGVDIPAGSRFKPKFAGEKGQ